MSFFTKCFFVLFFLAFYAQAYFVEIGFALKLYYVLAILIFVLNIKKFKITILYYEFFMFCFFAYYIATAFVSIDMYSSLRLILGIILAILVYFITKFSMDNLYDHGQLENIISLSYSVFVLLSLGLYIIGLYTVGGHFENFNSEKILGVMIDRRVPRLIGVASDPNFYALYSTFGLYFLIFRQNKSFLEKCILILSIITLLLTFSRGGIFSIAFVLILYSIFKSMLILYKLKISNKMLMLFSIESILAFAITCVIFFNEKIYGMVSQRINSISSGSGRFEIWKNGIQLFKENFLVGIGLYNFRFYNLEIFNDGHYMHNTHLGVLVESGVLGIFFYAVFHFIIFATIVNIYRKNNNYIYILLSYFSILIHLCGLSAIINGFIFFFLAYLGCVVKNEKRYEISSFNIYC